MVEFGWTQQNVFAECVQNMIQWFKKKDIQAGWQDRVFLKKKKRKGKTGNPSAVCLFHFKNTLFNRQIQVYVTPKRSRLVGNVFMSHQWLLHRSSDQRLTFCFDVWIYDLRTFGECGRLAKVHCSAISTSGPTLNPGLADRGQKLLLSTVVDLLLSVCSSQI